MPYNIYKNYNCNINYLGTFYRKWRMILSLQILSVLHFTVIMNIIIVSFIYLYKLTVQTYRVPDRNTNQVIGVLMSNQTDIIRCRSWILTAANHNALIQIRQIRNSLKTTTAFEPEPRFDVGVCCHMAKSQDTSIILLCLRRISYLFACHCTLRTSGTYDQQE